MTTKFCKSEFPFEKIKNNFSFNKKDKSGLMNVFLLSISGILGISSVIQRNNNYLYIYGGGAFASFGILAGRIYKNPIEALYMMSSILTLGIRTPEFLDKDYYFPKNRVFEDPTNFEALKDEVIRILEKTENGDKLKMTSETFSGQNKYIGSDIRRENDKIKAWRVINLKVGTEYSPDANKHFPALVQLLKDMPEVCSCSISVLQEGVHIPIHVGYYKGIMRYMIPIIVPKDREKVFLCVNELKYSWTEGVGVLWDDTYPHKVYNNTNEIRVVIYMDVVRPLSGFLNSMNRFILRLASNSKIVKDEIKKTEIQVKNKE
jgi:beta-hydroxylase